MDSFEIPIVLFIFKRYDTVAIIIERVRKVAPKRLYLISDGGRNASEHNIVLEVRKRIEQLIDWDCDVIYNYADVNKGVYDRIGRGAKWVFERERVAIFLEDDNLPETSFFPFCAEMLERYENDTRIGWICGTNYLQRFDTVDSSSYVFTRHLMPCGWASWSRKFLEFYDGELELLAEPGILKKLAFTYENKHLYYQQLYNILGTKDKLEKDPRKASWDYQMTFSIRIGGLLGISPALNQIRNIGVDALSTHGGTSLLRIMTRRFCTIKSFCLPAKLQHPRTIAVDPEYERRVGKYILIPLQNRVLIALARILKPLFGVGKYDSLPGTLKTRIRSYLLKNRRDE